MSVPAEMPHGLVTRNGMRIGLSLGGSTHAGSFRAEVRMRAVALVRLGEPITSAAIKLGVRAVKIGDSHLSRTVIIQFVLNKRVL